MTENEKITINGKEVTLYREVETNLYRFSKDAVDMLLEALEEREQYRAIGTVEDIEKGIKQSEEEFNMLMEYRAIGTIDEFKALKEKSEPKKIKYEEYCGFSDPVCPECKRDIDSEDKYCVGSEGREDMERLTARNETGQAYYKQCFEESCSGMGEQNCALCDYHNETVCERLAAYEDTDLEPEKIKELSDMFLEKCEEVNRLNVELAEYKKFLPCNIGDTVYVVEEWLDSGEMRVIEYTFDGIESGGYRLMYEGNKEDVDVFPVDDLDRVIFLSEAEALKRLEKINVNQKSG